MRISSDKLGLLGFIVIMALSALFHVSDPETTAPDPDRRRPVIGEAQPRRPIARTPIADPGGRPDFVIDLGRKRDSTGTAFSIGEGVWMTARHVVDGCRRLGIVTGRRKVERAREIIVHPNADLAIFRTGNAAAPLGFENASPESGQTAFHFGFPQGKPGDVRSTMLGHATMGLRGRYRTREPVIAWAERVRVPNSSEPLSGISGGPVVDADGQVIGVHVAGSKRRGRSFTTAPESMWEMLERAGVVPLEDSHRALRAAVTDDDFPHVGKALRRQLTVAQAVCRVR